MNDHRLILTNFKSKTVYLKYVLPNSQEHNGIFDKNQFHQCHLTLPRLPLFFLPVLPALLRLLARWSISTILAGYTPER